MPIHASLPLGSPIDPSRPASTLLLCSVTTPLVRAPSPLPTSLGRGDQTGRGPARQTLQDGERRVEQKSALSSVWETSCGLRQLPGLGKDRQVQALDAHPPARARQKQRFTGERIARVQQGGALEQAQRPP